jgi:glyoxylate reductase
VLVRALYHQAAAVVLAHNHPTGLVRPSRADEALTRGLRAGELAGAGLDVYENGRVNPRLKDLPNVVLLPHMGSATIEGRIEMGEKVIINIKTFADGHRPPDQVVPGML